MGTNESSWSVNRYGSVLTSVIRWLSNRNIDVTVVEIQLLEDDGRTYLHAEQTIPVPEQSDADVSPDTSEEPWKAEGRRWHLEKRSNDKTDAVLEEVAAAIGEIESLDGPQWGQKYYVSYRQNREVRIALRTKVTLFHVDTYDITIDDIDPDKIANILDISSEDVKAEESLRGGRPGVRITCHGDQGIDPDELRSQVRSLLTSDE